MNFCMSLVYLLKNNIEVVLNQYVQWFQNGGRTKFGFYPLITYNFETAVRNTTGYSFIFNKFFSTQSIDNICETSFESHNCNYFFSHIKITKFDKNGSKWFARRFLAIFLFPNNAIEPHSLESSQKFFFSNISSKRIFLNNPLMSKCHTFYKKNLKIAKIPIFRPMPDPLQYRIQKIWIFCVAQFLVYFQIKT